jgi:predicted transport protein
MDKGLLEKTGKPLEHWLKIVKESKIKKHKAIIDFLKSEHGFTYGFANFVSLKARKSDAGSMDATDLLTNQYKGKENLKPIYEKLLEKIGEFGNDITITPKKDSVSFIRKRQFILIKPATKTRIDLGLKLKGKELTERLESSGPFGAMCTHRVRLDSIKDVDSELIGWIKEAYQKSE